LGVKIRDESIDFNNMTTEEKFLHNLKEASDETQKNRLRSKYEFLKQFSDEELKKELLRRKQEKKKDYSSKMDEEDLLNFDPKKGYSIFNAVKGLLGSEMMGLSSIVNMLKEVGIDVENFDIKSINLDNIKEKVKDMMTPENIDKIKDKIMEFVEEFQESLDMGDIDKDGLMKNIKKVMTFVQKAMSGEDTNENLTQEAKNLLLNMIPKESRGKVKDLLKNMESTPEAFGDLLQHPEKLKDLLKDKRAQNKMADLTRADRARDRLRQKLDKKNETKDDTKNDTNMEDVKKELEELEDVKKELDSLDKKLDNMKKKH